MPKTNDETGATYDGYEGIVEHAGGRSSTRVGGLSQLHPSRDLDGEPVEGYDGPDLDENPNEVVIPAAPQESPAAPGASVETEERDSAGDGERSDVSEKAKSEAPTVRRPRSQK